MNNKNVQIVNELSILFANWSGTITDNISKLPHSGSSRIYFRLSSGKKSALGVYNENSDENNAFFQFTEHFFKHNLNVPQIYSKNISKNIYLIEDLGEIDLLGWLTKTRQNNVFPENAIDIYKLVLKELIKFQIIAGTDFDYTYCYPFKSFNKDAILFDLNYFTNQFVIPGQYVYNQIRLENDFNTLANFLLQENSNFFMYRDFQARNILLKNKQPYFIDYQGGRKGPLQYDVASLLYQAKANIPEEIRRDLLSFYISEAEKLTPIDREKFIPFFYAFALLRILQTLGAYGLRGLVEGKNHFIESIGPALSNLAMLIVKTDILNQAPELKELVKRITANTSKNES